MVRYYCNCLNICVQFGEDSDRLDEYYLSDEEKQDIFFQQLPLIIVEHCIISEQHTALIQFTVIGSWIVHKCIHCSIYTHAAKSDEKTTVVFLNESLKKLTDQESEIIKKSSGFSPVFQILVADFLHPIDYFVTNNPEDETIKVTRELKGILHGKLEEQKERTDKVIKKFVLEQENFLKDFIKRANEDYLSIETAVLSSYGKEKNSPKMPLKHSQETKSNSVINFFDLSTNPSKVGTKGKGRSCSFDSEGLFLFDGMERSQVSGDESHSEEDVSDIDDAGNRDEGIHIPRKRSITIARSLPIKMRADFHPPLQIRLVDDKLDANREKHSYKRKMRNERPIDIAANMKALAKSVHGDYIFGDLPPPRIGSRI